MPACGGKAEAIVSRQQQGGPSLRGDHGSWPLIALSCAADLGGKPWLSVEAPRTGAGQAGPPLLSPLAWIAGCLSSLLSSPLRSFLPSHVFPLQKEGLISRLLIAFGGAGCGRYITCLPGLLSTSSEAKVSWTQIGYHFVNGGVYVPVIYGLMTCIEVQAEFTKL